MLEAAIWKIIDDLREGEQGLPLDVSPDLEDGGGELVHLHQGGLYLGPPVSSGHPPGTGGTWQCSFHS